MENLTLAITNIADLLLHERLTNDKEGRINYVKLNMPEYQRPYKWTAKSANQLFNDILDAK